MVLYAKRITTCVGSETRSERKSGEGRKYTAHFRLLDSLLEVPLNKLN
jgi:hypothetical protein